MRVVGVLLLCCGLSACHTPQRGSEEYWFNKLKDEQRMQCRELPEPLATSCLTDLEQKSYHELLKTRQERASSK